MLRLRDPRDGALVAEVSQANPGLIARDLAHLATRRKPLAAMSVGEIVDRCRDAAEIFAASDLPLGDERVQTPADYLRSLAATTGMPLALGRRNLEKLRRVLSHMEDILRGLTAGLEPSVFDHPDRDPSFVAESDALGAVLPSNSPGVHGLWLPAVALKMALVLKPGREEPWTPYRLIQALMTAGLPREIFHYYPSGHDGAIAVLQRSGRALLFGGGETVAPWRHDPRVEVHGPGLSKIVLADEAAARFDEHLGVLVASILDNGGRSCLNASGVWATARADAIADALAERLAAVPALPLDDPAAELAAFASPETARAIDRHLERLLASGGAVDVTARYRPGPRLVEVAGSTFLLPTIVRCGPEHPLAHTELLLPFAAVVETDAGDLPSRLGPTLVATAIGATGALRDALLAARNIDRLNLGAIATTTIEFGQPHEGNLVSLLYRRRALQQRQ